MLTHLVSHTVLTRPAISNTMATSDILALTAISGISVTLAVLVTLTNPYSYTQDSLTPSTFIMEMDPKDPLDYLVPHASTLYDIPKAH